jgi:hypothetical protein
VKKHDKQKPTPLKLEALQTLDGEQNIKIDQQSILFCTRLPILLQNSQTLIGNCSVISKEVNQKCQNL